jgi:hypothetical protein
METLEGLRRRDGGQPVYIADESVMWAGDHWTRRHTRQGRGQWCVLAGHYVAFVQTSNCDVRSRGLRASPVIWRVGKWVTLRDASTQIVRDASN